MYQFSLHTPEGEHIGFLIMLANDEQHPTNGQLALKLLSNLSAQLLHKHQPIVRLAREKTLFWTIASERVTLFDVEQTPCASIYQQWLNIGGEHYLLNDLTGTL